VRSLPLFNIPPAAILRGGALSGAFHPNGSRLKDMTITADFFRRRRAGSLSHPLVFLLVPAHERSRARRTIRERTSRMARVRRPFFQIQFFASRG
jgi:hypothetical protein